MGKIILSFSILFVSSIGFAQSRYAYFCEASHSLFPNKYMSSFFMVVDLDSVQEIDEKKYVDAYIETTSPSKLPEIGLQEIYKLELTKNETIGDKIYFDVKAEKAQVGFDFETVGSVIPDQGNFIFLSAPEFDEIPLDDGKCIRRPDQDLLWLNP